MDNICNNINDTVGEIFLGKPFDIVYDNSEHEIYRFIDKTIYDNIMNDITINIWDTVKNNLENEING